MPKLNMAAFGKRAHHSKGFYRSLNRLSSADFTQKSRRNRKTVDGRRMFAVDRIITFREGRCVSWRLPGLNARKCSRSLT